MARDDDDDDGGTRAREKAAGQDSAADRPEPAGFEPDAARRPSRSAVDRARRHLACRSGHPSLRALRKPRTRSSARGRRARARASLTRTPGSPLDSARTASCYRTFCEQNERDINVTL